MAILGHGREEIVKSLREELGTEDREAPLERVGNLVPSVGLRCGPAPFAGQIEGVDPGELGEDGIALRGAVGRVAGASGRAAGSRRA